VDVLRLLATGKLEFILLQLDEDDASASAFIGHLWIVDFRRFVSGLLL